MRRIFDIADRQRRDQVFFGSWTDLGRVLLVGTLAYVWLIFFQRVSGKRTLSKMNAFDLIVTVALGSTLATILLSREVSLAEGVLALTLLMGLQYVVTWLSVRYRPVDRMVKSEPTLLFYRGEYLRDAMCRQRVVESEILQAVRNAGVLSTDDVEAIVLETDGEFSVVRKGGEQDRTSLADVKGVPES